MRPVIAAALFVLLACSDTIAPVTVGAPYQLRVVNGQPLPWSTPPSDSEYIPMTITDGSVTFLDDSNAQREEKTGRWVLTPSGDSQWLAYDWMQIAFYKRGVSSIVLTYPGYIQGTIGPSHAAETLYVTRCGLMMLSSGETRPVSRSVKPPRVT